MARLIGYFVAIVTLAQLQFETASAKPTANSTLAVRQSTVTINGYTYPEECQTCSAVFTATKCDRGECLCDDPDPSIFDDPSDCQCYQSYIDDFANCLQCDEKYGSANPSLSRSQVRVDAIVEDCNGANFSVLSVSLEELSSSEEGPSSEEGSSESGSIGGVAFVREGIYGVVAGGVAMYFLTT